MLLITCTVALAALAGCSAPSSPDSTVAPTTGSSSSDAADALVDLTNVERARSGLPALRAQSRLTRAARIQAEQLAATGRLEHTLADARYPTLGDRLSAAGYTWQAAGENLASGQESAARAVETWMNSSAHRANILNTIFTDIGAATVVDRSGRDYYVQVFGRSAAFLK